jgi:hypothetical protein
MFIFEDTVLTIQEGKEPLACWDPVRDSLEKESKLRANDGGCGYCHSDYNSGVLSIQFS